MKYKLIKEYPGSPKLGYITTPKNDDAYYVNSNWIQPENYPEFWEKVKDYEILSLIEDKFIYPCDKYGKDFINQLFNTLGVSIHSVKRKDGEIFTIGDKLNKSYISNILLQQDIIWLMCQGDSINSKLNDAIKIKQPLFTTEDGVDIFENNTSIFIIDKLTIRYIKHKDFNVISKYVKYFSTKEKAEDYILMNKPCLSLKEIYDLTDQNSGLYNESDLEKLVKQKLNK